MSSFDWRSLAAEVGAYQDCSQLHRPTGARQVAEAARSLRAQGLTAGDIGVALRLSSQAVEAMLGESTRGSSS